MGLGAVSLFRNSQEVLYRKEIYMLRKIVIAFIALALFALVVLTDSDQGYSERVYAIKVGVGEGGWVTVVNKKGYEVGSRCWLPSNAYVSEHANDGKVWWEYHEGKYSHLRPGATCSDGVKFKSLP